VLISKSGTMHVTSPDYTKPVAKEKLQSSDFAALRVYAKLQLVSTATCKPLA